MTQQTSASRLQMRPTMRPQLLAHLSDLHLGRPGAALAAEAICQRLLEANVDHVIVTGDLTHGGRAEELAQFERIFKPFRGRLTAVPGNHDRLHDEVARWVMGDKRVEVSAAPGLFVVRVDSTGQHNRSPLSPHGDLTEADLNEIDAALALAPHDALVAIALHHHVHELPIDNMGERLAHRIGISSDELELGETLLRRIAGRVDVIFHGHRHQPSEQLLWTDPSRPIAIYNAGSTTELRQVRLFTHHHGLHVQAPRWLNVPPSGKERAARSLPPVLEALRSVSMMFL